MTNETDGCVLDTNNNIVARTWSFTLQNLNLMPIHSITTLSKTPGVSFSVSPASFSGGLPYNGTVPVTLTITGGAAMQKVCVCLIARNQAGQEICREEFCRKLPCVKLSNIQVTCHPLGGVNIEFDWTNLSSTPVSYLSLGPTGSSQNIQPGGQSYSTPVPVGGTAHFGPVRWQGPNIAGEYCFSLGLANPSFLQCCVQKVCLLLPACPGPPYTGTGSGDHGGGQLCRTTHPQNQILTWPGSCVEVCDVNTFCHPTLPNTWHLVYRVSNIGNFQINQLMYPDPNLTPGFFSTGWTLGPGQSKLVMQTISNATPGPYTVSFMATNPTLCRCCLFRFTTVLNPCPCLSLQHTAVCAPGIEEPGKFCYVLSFSGTNLSNSPITQVAMSSSTLGVTFNPPVVPLGTVAPNQPFAGTVIMCVPTNVTILGIIYGAQNNNAPICAEQLGIQVTPCCTCTGGIPPSPAPGVPPLGVWLNGIEEDPASPGCFRLTERVTGGPCLYFAKTATGTAVRMNSLSGVVEGEYYTMPQAFASVAKPQRVHVDKYGEAWIANSGGDTKIVFNKATKRLHGSITRIGCVVGGTRGNVVNNVFTPSPTGTYLKGPFTYLSPSVRDRNGDGYIRTAVGVGAPLPWDPANTGGNHLGGVSLAQDELIVNFTRVPSVEILALAIDCDNNLWAGGRGNSLFTKVDGQTGANTGITLGMPRPWGSFVNGDNNVLMSLQYGVNIGRHNFTNLLGFTSCSGGNGITLDPSTTAETGCTLVVSADALSSDFGFFKRFLLRRYNSLGVLIDADPQQEAYAGLSVRRNGMIPCARKAGLPGSVHHHNATLAFNSTSLGYSRICTTAVDEQDNVWALDATGNSVHRVAPPLTTNLLPGAVPENMNGDHSGLIAAISGCRTGFMVYTHDSGCDDTPWGTLKWTESFTPLHSPGCKIVVEVRSANNPLNFPVTWSRVWNNVPFCGLGLQGRYLQVRVTLARRACDVECNPAICNLTWECCPTEMEGGVSLEIEPHITLTSDSAGGGVSSDGAAPQRLSVLRMVRFGASDADGPGSQWPAVAQWYVDGAPLGGAAEVGTVIEPPMLVPGDHTYDVVVRQLNSTAHARVRVTDWTIDRDPPRLRVVREIDIPDSVVGPSAPVPNVLPIMRFTDNLTPANQIVVTQNPHAGTAVGIGVHRIDVTATDLAGNTTRATHWFHVENPYRIEALPPVVAPGQPITFKLIGIPVGNPVPIDPWWNCFPTDRVTAIGGVVVLPPQPPGTHELRLHIPTAHGDIETEPVIVHVLATAPPRVPISLIPSSSGLGWALRTQVPPGWNALLEATADPAQEWTPFATVRGSPAPQLTGTGDVTPATAPRFFYRAQLYPDDTTGGVIGGP